MKIWERLILIISNNIKVYSFTQRFPLGLQHFKNIANLAVFWFAVLISHFQLFKIFCTFHGNVRLIYWFCCHPWLTNVVYIPVTHRCCCYWCPRYSIVHVLVKPVSDRWCWHPLLTDVVYTCDSPVTLSVVTHLYYEHMWLTKVIYTRYWLTGVICYLWLTLACWLPRSPVLCSKPRFSSALDSREWPLLLLLLL